MSKTNTLFLDTPFLRGTPYHRLSYVFPGEDCTKPPPSNNQTLVIALSVVGGVFLIGFIMVVIAVAFFISRRRRRRYTAIQWSQKRAPVKLWFASLKGYTNLVIYYRAIFKAVSESLGNGRKLQTTLPELAAATTKDSCILISGRSNASDPDTALV